jgi:hypothetical protein
MYYKVTQQKSSEEYFIYSTYIQYIELTLRQWKKPWHSAEVMCISGKDKKSLPWGIGTHTHSLPLQPNDRIRSVMGQVKKVIIHVA